MAPHGHGGGPGFGGGGPGGGGFRGGPGGKFISDNFLYWGNECFVI